MNLELTEKQRQVLQMALLSRVKTIENLIEGWERYPSEDTDFLIEHYKEELVAAKELEGKIF